MTSVLEALSKNNNPLDVQSFAVYDSSGDGEVGNVSVGTMPIATICSHTYRGSDIAFKRAVR